MTRFHVHVGVTNLAESVRFYSALFGAQPSVFKEDYAKWMLEDPRVNFAISTRSGRNGVDHLGFQVDSDAALSEIETKLKIASDDVVGETDTACCYAKSDKYWIQDPAGIAWEAFHSLASIPMFGEAPKIISDTPDDIKAACCSPAFGENKSDCC